MGFKYSIQNTISMTTKTRILTTSIVAFAVLALMVPPNIAHATLIGDDYLG